MDRKLIADWGAYQLAFDHLLGLATHRLCIYDEDLATLCLDFPNRLSQVNRLLKNAQPESIKIFLRNAEPFRRQKTHLIQHLVKYSHIVSIREALPETRGLRDSMVLVDEQHALIRFDRDQARSKLLINKKEELSPYLWRFEQIWNEPGNAVGATTLGL